ncbi:MAG: PD-(D/E)XK nuclease family protein, partial [Paludibacteraceae bacterium]|nr:PD-(D/E)XK nuclease family protein [Paludibacteraceae bacterium]
MSRFMQQIAVEKPESTTLSSYSMQSTIESAEREEISTIEKTPEVMEKLKKFDSISPSALNKYISCPLSYYYKYIAGLKDNEDTELGEVDAIKFGLIFHDSMDTLYSGLKNNILTAEILKAKRKEADKVVEQKFREEIYGEEYKDEIVQSGVQMLTLNTLKHYVKKMIDIDIYTAENSDEFMIIDTEGTYHKHFENTRLPKVGGIIDRIDSIKKDGETTIRIIDYKTTTRKDDMDNVEGIFRGKKNSRGYYFQTFLYSTIIKDNNPDKNVVPALIYIFSAKKEDNPVLKMGTRQSKVTISDIGDYEEEFNELLKATLEELFDENTPFRVTQNDNECEYCTFKSLCNHKTKQKEEGEG